MMEWISVEDRLPEPEQEVIYYFELTGISIGKFWKNRTMLAEIEINMNCFGGAKGWLCDDVTHWMPLPEPPE